MRVLIVNTSEKTGGAAVAANRLMEALNNNGEKAKMLVRDKQTDCLTVVSAGDGWRQRWHFLWERWRIFMAMHFSKKHLFEVDIANAGTDITGLPEFREADVIHLHWINQGFLSLSVIQKILQSGKPVVLCVNKVDSGEKIYDTYQFYSLGLGEVWSISAANGSGTGDLLDEVLRLLPESETEKDDDRPDLPHIAIVGKPNVGKSSLTNALLGEERNIVTPVAGTTRDSISTHYNKFGHEFMLVDTAGMRRKNRVNEDLEFYSVMRAIRSIERADVCILMIDATAGMEAQDMSIFNLILRNRKGCVVVVNKWDLFIKDNNTLKEYETALKKRLAPFDDVPVIFTSVVKKQRIMDVLDAAAHVYENYSRRLTTARLNEVMLPEIENYPPPAWKGKYVKIKYITQLPTRFPAFAFFCNHPQYVKEP